MKRPRTFFPLSCFLLASSILGAAPDDLLRIEASCIPRKLSRGEEGAVILKLSVQPGIVVSPYPDFIIEFKPVEELVFPKNFFTASDLEINALETKGEEGLDFSSPLKIPFAVSLRAKKGSHILEGKVKYFARSGEEGWCVRNTAKFYVTFYTRASTPKSKTAD